MKPNHPALPSRAPLIAVGVMTAIALALTGCGDDDIAKPATQYGSAPVLPAPQQYLIPPMKVLPAGSWKFGERPVVAAGLTVAPLVTGLMHPRMVYVLPNGDVLVVESNGPGSPVLHPKDLIMGKIKAYGGTSAKGGNRITLVRPAHEGTAETRTIFLDHLHSPFGVALVGNELYVANTDAVMRYPYVTGATQITAPGVKLADLPAGPIDHHWTKSLLASADGAKLYVGVGSNSNITENGMGAELNRATIFELDRQSGATRIFASGLRNPNSMQWEPFSKKMWVVVNERDEIGPNLVPDYLTSVQDGGFYGWPYSYYGQHIDPRVMPQKPELVAKALVPDYALSSHVAPLGLAFSNGAALTDTYREGAFVAEHGSWDRSPVNGYKVVFVPFKEGKPAGPPVDVVTGFLRPDNHANGRPVGLALDHSGALLVADDVGNTVWRVSAAAPN
ncbi:MAG: sorbosone dehydrogenase family protein [Pseudomonadota bacterium]|nr:sorbosone dehydrogenase family protein [Pseudomonadota bacterium]